MKFKILGKISKFQLIFLIEIIYNSSQLMKHWYLDGVFAGFRFLNDFTKISRNLHTQDLY